MGGPVGPALLEQDRFFVHSSAPVRPVYDGLRKSGELFVCTACGHRYRLGGRGDLVRNDGTGYALKKIDPDSDLDWVLGVSPP